MSRLRACDDLKVQAYLRLLTPGTHFYRVDDNRPHFKTHMKNRVVDPGVLQPGWTEPRRLSAISDEYEAEIAPIIAVRNIDYKLWSDRIEPGLL